MSTKVHFWYVSIPLTMLFAVPSPLLARSRQEPPLSATRIHQMVENVAWNQLQASEHPAHYYRFVERDIMPDGSTTVDEIATPQGNVSRLIGVDHRTPDRQQLAKNQQLLSELPDDSQLQQSRFKDQQNDRQRRNNVIKDLPQAFIYTFDGRDQQGRIKLKFQPAPDFQPSSRQSLILQGMAGELWVDPATQRMVKIDGSLIRDVKIGWGFLARLNRGGTFLMEQSQAPDGTSHQTLLSVHFDGTVLLLKHIQIRVKQIQCCFERVPDNLTIREAVQLLESSAALPEDWQARLEAIQKSAPPD